MKIRSGLISNSSSSSFIIRKTDLTEEQIDKIYRHVELSNQVLLTEEQQKDEWMYHCDEWDEWQITETTGWLEGYTNMANFSMAWYLGEIIGLDMSKARFEDEG